MICPSLTQVAFAAAMGWAIAAPLRARGGDEPGLPYDPATTSYCSWWIDFDGSQTCEEILEWNWIELKDFYRWNPSVSADCSGLEGDKSYCVEAWGEPEPEPEPVTETTTTTATAPSTSITSISSTTITSTSTTQASMTTTTTAPGYEIETPSPVHIGIVDNCNKFHLIEAGDGCAAIAQKHGIRTADVVSWNGLNAGCTDLWGDTYACIGIIGQEPATTEAPSTTASTGNGIETPAPIHSGIVSNCNEFHLVKEGDSCAVIAQKHGIRTTDVVSWNGLNAGCTDLWGDTYACVRVVGWIPETTTSSATTTTTAGNGIQTPDPVQKGLVSNCNKFHFVQPGDTCVSMAERYGIRNADVVAWNGLDSGCTDLWSSTYACVGVVGSTPTVPEPTTTTTTTTTGNGIATPTPIQAGMVKDCTKFHFVRPGVSCQQILSYNKITVAQFYRWNPAVGPDCNYLWANTHACVAGP